MKQLNQIKLTTKKFLLLIGVLFAGFQVQAQKVGDNLGNHTAIKDLDIGKHNIVNASGAVIGSVNFTTIPNTSVSLELAGTDKAFLVNRVDDLFATTSPITNTAVGMMVYNKKDSKFYFFDGKGWETFATPSPSGLTVWTVTAGDFGTSPNGSGLTVTTTAGNVKISLEAATVDYPGVVTTATQAFAGTKNFQNDLNVGGAITVGGAATITGATTIAGTTTISSGSLNISKTVPVSTNPADYVLVVDGNGAVKTSTMSAGLIGNAIVQIPVGFSAKQTPNSYFSLVFKPVKGVNIDDGVVVNFKNSDIGTFTGITIKSAVATNTDEVTVYLEDDRNPDPDPALGYKALSIDLSSLIITWIHKN